MHLSCTSRDAAEGRESQVGAVREGPWEGPHGGELQTWTPQKNWLVIIVLPLRQDSCFYQSHVVHQEAEIYSYSFSLPHNL